MSIATSRLFVMLGRWMVLWSVQGMSTWFLGRGPATGFAIAWVVVVVVVVALLDILNYALYKK